MVKMECDVIVVGGGFAGASAAFFTVLGDLIASF